MMKHLSITTLCALAIATGAAPAGEVAEFETEFRATYAEYRQALFRTNAGGQEASASAAAGFAEAWAGLVDDWRDRPPPHYDDDTGWRATLDSVSARIESARGRIEAGDLPAAHEKLEGVREDIAALRDRNGIETFSDRMNAYHAQMEHVLDLDLAAIDADTGQALLEGAAVLSYLAEDVMRRPPPEAEAGSDEFDALGDAFEASVAAFLEACRAGEPEAIRAAADGLKGPYSKLFLEFG